MEQNHSQNKDAAFYDTEKVASTMDCTGLIPSAVTEEDEAQAYAELYAVHPVKPENLENTSKAAGRERKRRSLRHQKEQ